MQKRKESSTILSLHQEIEREVREIEKEMERHPELDGLRVTEEMDKALLEEIQAYEAEMEENRRGAENTKDGFRCVEEHSAGIEKTDRLYGHNGEDASGRLEKRGDSEDSVEFSAELAPDLERISSLSRSAAGDNGKERKYIEAGEGGEKEKKVCYRRRKRKYWVVSLVAVLVIVLGVGVNCVGSKSYLKTIKDALLGGESIKYVDVEDMEIQEIEDGEELAIYKEIEDKFHIKPVRLIYKPDDMKLADYEIHEEILTARLLYKYKDEVIRYILYVNDVDSSWGGKEEDVKVDEYDISVNGLKIRVEEYKVNNNIENRKIAYFEYNGICYQLIGIMEKGELEKILKNLYFF